jgi:hypothetical protein
VPRGASAGYGNTISGLAANALHASASVPTTGSAIPPSARRTVDTPRLAATQVLIQMPGFIKVLLLNGLTVPSPVDNP